MQKCLSGDDHNGRLQARLELLQTLAHESVCAKAGGGGANELLRLAELLLSSETVRSEHA
eukprot:6633562-Prymnesium_polylepis.1